MNGTLFMKTAITEWIQEFISYTCNFIRSRVMLNSFLFFALTMIWFQSPIAPVGDDMQTDIKKHIQTLLLEIETYRSHSLFKEAKRRYAQMASLIRKNPQFKNKEKLLAVISKKIEGLEDERIKFEEIDSSVTMSTRDQDLVKKLFVSSVDQDSDSAALEGALALLEFGQFENALTELNNLLENDATRVVAAKNILRCQVGMSSIDAAVAQYQQWFSDGRFPAGQLEEIRSLLQDILGNKKIDITLPGHVEIADDADDDIWEEDFIDILSIVIPLLGGVIEGRDEAVLDVSFQNGVVLSVILPHHDQELVDLFKVGMRLEDLQFYSSDITFIESCVVSEKKEIKTGPKAGDTVLTIKILIS
jgi:tetratricopeptide (TPR) repeat protein